MCKCRLPLRKEKPNLSGVISNDITETIYVNLFVKIEFQKPILEEDGEKPLPMSCQASLRYSSVNIWNLS